MKLGKKLTAQTDNIDGKQSEQTLLFWKYECNNVDSLLNNYKELNLKKLSV